MISDQITILNDTTLECLNETDEQVIVTRFTEVGLKVLGADFGFVWLNSSQSKDLELVYKSPTTPYIPKNPKEDGRNYKVIESGKPDFVSEVTKRNDEYDVSSYMKSFVIIPLVYKEGVYGSMVFCFKNGESFPREKRILSTFIGNSVAQTITISRLFVGEREARTFSERQEARFRALIEHSYEVIMQLDTKGTILYVSSSARRILGFDPADMIGKSINEFTYDAQGKKKDYLKKIIENKRQDSLLEFYYKTHAGTLIFLESTSSALLGRERGIVLNIRDVTERKKFEQMKESKRLLEEERFKIQSIADATHELRTPLAIIKGNVDLALYMKTKEKAFPTKTFKAIDEEVRHLSGILSDLSLITSKKDETKRRVVYGTVDLVALISSIVSRFTVIAGEKGIALIFKHPKKITIEGDEIYLERMITNLMKNSIIYGNQNGETEITLTKTKKAVKIAVKDTGIGISKEDMPHVFERFYRADKSHSSDDKSTGLGLAVVKWIAEAHHGEVGVKKNPKGGSIFTVILPLPGNIK